MKRLLTMTFALVGLLFFVACEGEQSADGSTLKITSPTEVTVGKYATEFVISYTADAKAEVALSSEWLRVRNHEGGTITVQVEDNETGGTRMAAVTLAVGAERATVVVNQLGVAEEATIAITSGDSIDVKRTGCKVTIEYTLEGKNPEDYVYVKSDADWIYSMDTNTEGEIELGVATNTTGKARETVVTIGYGTATASMTLRQAGDGEILFDAPIITGADTIPKYCARGSAKNNAHAVPTRARATCNPMASASSCPVNHFAITFVTVIPAISQPMP